MVAGWTIGTSEELLPFTATPPMANMALDDDDANMTLNEVGGVALCGKKMMMHMTLNEVVWQENSGQSFYWQLTPPHPFSC